METWHNVPLFGARSELAVCVIRPSAYALIEDDKERLAVVRTAQGTYLPGGGIEAGESPEETITREVREECGLIIRPGSWSVHAIQLVYSNSEQTQFEKRSTFIEGVIDETLDALNPNLSEADHELIWTGAEQAVGMLSQESHSWAVEAWRSRSLLV